MTPEEMNYIIEKERQVSVKPKRYMVELITEGSVDEEVFEYACAKACAELHVEDHYMNMPAMWRLWAEVSEVQLDVIIDSVGDGYWLSIVEL